MTTTHARALEDSFYETIRSTPQMALAVVEARNRILDGGFYSQDVIDAAFQKWERDRGITLVDAFGFAQVWAHLQCGDIAYCSVPLPSGPGQDREIEFNQSILNRLPDGFRAEYSPTRGRGADDDGLFTIEEGIGLWRTFREEEDASRDEPWFFKEDYTVALEVGTTSASKTLWHLRCGRGVARWPYGYSKIKSSCSWGCERTLSQEIWSSAWGKTQDRSARSSARSTFVLKKRSRAQRPSPGPTTLRPRRRRDRSIPLHGSTRRRIGRRRPLPSARNARHLPRAALRPSRRVSSPCAQKPEHVQRYSGGWPLRRRGDRAQSREATAMKYQFVRVEIVIGEFKIRKITVLELCGLFELGGPKTAALYAPEVAGLRARALFLVTDRDPFAQVKAKKEGHIIVMARGEQAVVGNTIELYAGLGYASRLN